MENSLSVAAVRVPAMSEVAIGKVRELEAQALQLPQVELRTSHVIHGGMYARTLFLPAGVLITGALIKIATILIVQGDATAYIGDRTLILQGYNVVPASKNRKQAFVAHADTYMTMLFPTDAVSVEEAEAQFTDEAEKLLSRKDSAYSHAIITGE